MDFLCIQANRYLRKCVPCSRCFVIARFVISEVYCIHIEKTYLGKYLSWVFPDDFTYINIYIATHVIQLWSNKHQPQILMHINGHWMIVCASLPIIIHIINCGILITDIHLYSLPPPTLPINRIQEKHLNLANMHMSIINRHKIRYFNTISGLLR